MGVTGLFKLLDDQGFASKIDLYSLSGQNVAVDLSIWVCQALYQSFGQQEDNALNNHHMRIAFFRAVALCKAGITPVFVLDGKPPKRKRRKGERAGIQRQFHLDSKFRKVCIEVSTMLQRMGFYVLQATVGEGEALCAQLERMGLVDGVITQDSDIFCFGTKFFLRDLQAGQLKMQANGYHVGRIGKQLHRNHFIALSLLLGSDYAEGVKGIGPVKGLECVLSFPGASILAFWKLLLYGPEKIRKALQLLNTYPDAVVSDLLETNGYESLDMEGNTLQRAELLAEVKLLMQDLKQAGAVNGTLSKAVQKTLGKLHTEYKDNEGGFNDIVRLYRRPGIDMKLVLERFPKSVLNTGFQPLVAPVMTVPNLVLLINTLQSTLDWTGEVATGRLLRHCAHLRLLQAATTPREQLIIPFYQPHSVKGMKIRTRKGLKYVIIIWQLNHTARVPTLIRAAIEADTIEGDILSQPVDEGPLAFPDTFECEELVELLEEKAPHLLVQVKDPRVKEAKQPKQRKKANPKKKKKTQKQQQQQQQPQQQQQQQQHDG
jgi:5'-3' exonuclease